MAASSKWQQRLLVGGGGDLSKGGNANLRDVAVVTAWRWYFVQRFNWNPLPIQLVTLDLFIFFVTSATLWNFNPFSSHVFGHLTFLLPKFWPRTFMTNNCCTFRDNLLWSTHILCHASQNLPFYWRYISRTGIPCSIVCFSKRVVLCVSAGGVFGKQNNQV